MLFRSIKASVLSKTYLGNFIFSKKCIMNNSFIFSKNVHYELERKNTFAIETMRISITQCNDDNK